MTDLGGLQEGLESVGRLVPELYAGTSAAWIQKLRDVLLALKATLEAKKKGMSVLRRSQPNGSIKLVLATL